MKMKMKMKMKMNMLILDNLIYQDLRKEMSLFIRFSYLKYLFTYFLRLMRRYLFKYLLPFFSFLFFLFFFFIIEFIGTTSEFPLVPKRKVSATQR